MFLGHYAIAFAAKRATPETSLGTLFLASVFIDLLWPLFLLIGLERARIDPGIRGLSPLVFEHYPVSHSLLAVLGWASLLGAAYFWASRDRRGALAVGALLISHWLLDAIVHRPDLPLLPGGQVSVGLGLWDAPLVSTVGEAMLFAGGLALYLSTVQGRVRRGALASLAALLLVIYVADVFGPPPPSMAAVAWAGLAQWLLVAAGYWVDRPRGQREALHA